MKLTGAGALMVRCLTLNLAIRNISGLKTVESLEFVIRNSSIFMIFAYSFIFKKGLSTVGVHMTWRIFIIYHAAVDAKLKISFEMCFCIRLQYVTFIS